MKKIEKILRFIIEACGIIGVVILLAMMMMTVFDVILRYFFSKPIIGSMEISVVLMVCVVFLGIGWCALNEGHISVDIITGKLSKRGRALLNAFDNIVTLVLALIIAWRSFIEALSAKEMEVSSPILGIPRYPFIIVTSFGFFLLFSAALILFFKNINSVKNPDRKD
jgi:TRAP-type C4-dicarboxylate transport system permease small subunit